MIRRPPRSTQSRSSAASDVYKRQGSPPRPAWDCDRRLILSLLPTRPTSLPVRHYQGHGLRPARRTGVEDAPHRGGHGNHPGLFDPPHGHTEMLRLDDHEDTERVKALHDGIRDLGGEPFLYLEPL